MLPLFHLCHKIKNFLTEGWTNKGKSKILNAFPLRVGAKSVLDWKSSGGFILFEVTFYTGLNVYIMYIK